ncbi:MAG: dihydroneopterin aldolase [Candidatus Kapaibacterium sp.]|nr:dihydroneopterin aldolase [Ignavibacteriota bacterium]MCB9220475.1 dihydroneopterin aldolase [Ignavibacteria bacterium]
MKKTSLSRITIKNAQYYAYHGVKQEERKLGGKYEVDLIMDYDAKSAIVRDDVNYALNYEIAMYCISEIMTGDSYSLIETIANEILNSVVEKFEFLKKATVRVRKINAPMKRYVDYVEVEQTIEVKDSEG